MYAGSLPPSSSSYSSYEEALASGRLSIGRGTYGKPVVHIYKGDHCKVRIGAFCSIGEEVEFLPGGSHEPTAISTYPVRELLNLRLDPSHEVNVGDTNVGSDVWIGRGAKILSEVQIGDGAIIGAYSVVATVVRPYAIVVGNPAREVGRRFDDHSIDWLLKIRWWEWPMDRIKRELPSLDMNLATRQRRGGATRGCSR